MEGNASSIWYFAIVALFCVLAGWGHYLATIPQNKVPKLPIFMFTTQITGIALASRSIFLALNTAQTHWGMFVTNGFALFMAVFFFILYSQRRTPLGEIQIKVGDSLPDFETTDSTGAIIHSADWRGNRILLKFFRGSW